MGLCSMWKKKYILERIPLTCCLSGRGTEHQLTYDGHEGVKVADVEAFPRHINEELDDSGSVFFLHRLGTKWRTLS